MDGLLVSLQLEGLIFLWAFLISSTSGFGWALRRNEPLTLRFTLSAILNCGMLGLIIALLFKHYWPERQYLLLACSGLAGIGGITTVQWSATLFRKIVLTVLEQKFGLKLVGSSKEQNGSDEPKPPVKKET